MGLLDMQISEFVCQIIFLRYFGIKSLYENLVIYSYKTILYCPFDNLNYTICGGSVHRQYFLRGTVYSISASRQKKKLL